MILLIVVEGNLIGIKRNFFYLNHELAHSDICNFLVHPLAEPFGTSDKIINKYTFCHLEIDNTFFKVTTQGLLIKTLKMLSVPGMR